MVDPNPIAHAFYWFEIHTGIARGGPDPWYNFWSGLGSDLGEIAIVGGMIQLVRHHNCHVKGCWRLGRHVEGTPFVACPIHHPDHPGEDRGVSQDQITLQFNDAKEAASAKDQPVSPASPNPGNPVPTSTSRPWIDPSRPGSGRYLPR